MKKKLNYILMYLKIFKFNYLIYLILVIYFSITGNVLSQSKNHIDDYSINYQYIKNEFNDKNFDKNLNIKKFDIQEIKNKNNYFIKGGTLNISKIGIYQPMYAMNIGDFNKNSLKVGDKNTINMEINDFSNIDSGFFIGGHSSGFWYDNSNKKEIFKDLQEMNTGDEIKMQLVTNIGNINKKYIVSKKVIGKNIMVKKTDKIIYTCYPNNTSEERLILFLEEY